MYTHEDMFQELDWMDCREIHFVFARWLVSYALLLLLPWVLPLAFCLSFSASS